MAKSKNPAEGKKSTDYKTDTGEKENNTGAQTETVGTDNNSDPVENLKNELSMERDKYLRLAAEYDNYRKRSTKEREMIYTDARIDAINKLLPVFDNLERALKTECTDESYYKGIEMIMTQLIEALNNMGVKEIPSVGSTFDPNLHNAVMTIVDPQLGENVVAEEYQKGFILGDRVIRFSTVVVAN